MESIKLPEDFIGNLAQIANSLHPVKTRVDLTGVNKTTDFGKRNVDLHKDFKMGVKKLAEIEDMVKKYTDLIRDLKKEKENLRQQTVDHMVKYNFDVARLNDNDRFNLVTVKRTVSPITKARLPTNLSDYFIENENMSNEEASRRAEDICKWIHEKAEKKMDQSLRRYKK